MDALTSPFGTLPLDAIFVDASGTILQSSYSTPLGVTLTPDASQLLAAFKVRKLGVRPIKTGLITNWGQKIHRILRGLDLEPYFDVVLCADDVSQGKPDPGIFLAACQQVGRPAERCLHVGDALYDDAIGAQEAGLQSIWVNRNNTWAHSEAMRQAIAKLHHPVVTNLDEAFHYLHSILQKP